MSTTDVILETRGLTKEFKGFVAVDNVNLKVQRGTIHALIGPNGAGKTTCFNLLTKFLTPTRGHIFSTAPTLRVIRRFTSHGAGSYVRFRSRRCSRI